MKQSVNEFQFIEAFKSIRPDNFSTAGLRVLFEYLEQYEEDCDTELELDVIAFCCEWTESTLQEIAEDYRIYPDDEESFNESIIEYLEENTTVLIVNNDTVIYQDF